MSLWSSFREEKKRESIPFRYAPFKVLRWVSTGNTWRICRLWLKEGSVAWRRKCSLVLSAGFQCDRTITYKLAWALFFIGFYFFGSFWYSSYEHKKRVHCTCPESLLPTPAGLAPPPLAQAVNSTQTIVRKVEDSISHVPRTQHQVQSSLPVM